MLPAVRYVKMFVSDCKGCHMVKYKQRFDSAGQFNISNVFEISHGKQLVTYIYESIFMKIGEWLYVVDTVYKLALEIRL